MVIPRGKLFRVEGSSEWKAIPSGDYRRHIARYPDVNQGPHGPLGKGPKGPRRGPLGPLGRDRWVERGWFFRELWSPWQASEGHAVEYELRCDLVVGIQSRQCRAVVTSVSR